MIIGVGVDIHDIRLIEANPANYMQHFTSAEREVCEARAERWAAYATRFCLKEAVMKALGSNDAVGGVNLIDIEIETRRSGRPVVFPMRGAARQLDAITPVGHVANIDVTASDSFPFAIGHAIIWVSKP